jgi:hypothetical protein
MMETMISNRGAAVPVSDSAPEDRCERIVPLHTDIRLGSSPIDSCTVENPDIARPDTHRCTGKRIHPNETDGNKYRCSDKDLIDTDHVRSHIDDQTCPMDTCNAELIQPPIGTQHSMHRSQRLHLSVDTACLRVRRWTGRCTC